MIFIAASMLKVNHQFSGVLIASHYIGATKAKGKRGHCTAVTLHQVECILKLRIGQKVMSVESHLGPVELSNVS